MAPSIRRAASLLALAGAPEAVYLATLPEPYWPNKNHDLNHTGFSPNSAPFDLRKPAWIFEEPDKPVKGLGVGPMKVFHSSPIMDSERNTYIVSTTGWMYSVDPEGKLRWDFRFSGTNPGNPALLDGILYTATDDGYAFAVEAATGKRVWRKRVAPQISSDTFSVVAFNGTVLVPTLEMPEKERVRLINKPIPECGNSELVALHASDGSVKWKYELTKRSKTLTVNVMPAIVDGSVVFSDTAGGLYRLGLEDGHEVWYQPGAESTWTTGGMSVGPNGMIYVAHQYRRDDKWNGKGQLSAHSLGTGALLWEKKYESSLQSAPAVGPLTPGGPLAVVIGVGHNMPPAPLPEAFKAGMVQFNKVQHGALDTSVHAVSAEDGHDIWSFELPFEAYTQSNKPSQFACAPDIWGTPAIGADGTVYMNWSGGRAWALRDANGDGRLDMDDAQEVSSYEHGFGSNGESAIAPGLLVAPSCNVLLGFKQ